MNIQPILQPQPSFCSNSLLKRLFKKGKLPEVEYGLYGGKLTQENATDEHVIPRSKGGKNDEVNIALATKSNNSARGNRPLKDYLTQENLNRYTRQFNDINLPEYKFNGKRYIKKLLQFIRRALGMG